MRHKPTLRAWQRAHSAIPVLLLVLITTVWGCGNDGETTATEMPEWVEAVYPQPGATLAVPDAVEVDHNLARLEEDVRLVIDGVDVTTYATFEAGKIRYESGVGPVELGTGSHTAEVQLVHLPAVGADYDIVDSFSWEFRTG